MSITTLTGSCLCGAAGYEFHGEPIMLYACHCSDCQTSSGSAFILSLRVPAGTIQTKRGRTKPYVRKRSDGRQRNIHRCPECLTALWSEHLEPSSYATLYAGTLDNSPSLRPDVHFWTQDAQPWIELPADVPTFAQNPPDMAALEAAIRSRRNR